jgi:hypothetical protein
MSNESVHPLLGGAIEYSTKENDKRGGLKMNVGKAYKSATQR